MTRSVYGSIGTPTTELATCSKPTRYAISPLTSAATRSKRYSVGSDHRAASQRMVSLTSSQPCLTGTFAPNTVTGSCIDVIARRGPQDNVDQRPLCLDLALQCRADEVVKFIHGHHLRARAWVSVHLSLAAKTVNHQDRPPLQAESELTGPVSSATVPFTGAAHCGWPYVPAVTVLTPAVYRRLRGRSFTYGFAPRRPGLAGLSAAAHTAAADVLVRDKPTRT